MTPITQKVVFRILHGEVIALLCNTASVCTPGCVMSYMHIGQHSEVSRYLGRHCRLATPDEYAPLLAELQGIYAPEFKIVPVSRLIN